MTQALESFPPLVTGLVHNRLFQVSPDLNKSLLQFSLQITNWFLMHALLHAARDFIIDGIQVRTTRRPQVRWNEIWRFITQEFIRLLIALGRLVRCPAGRCTCLLPADRAAGTRPIPNFSSTMNPQLNGSALCEKSFQANLF